MKKSTKVLSLLLALILVFPLIPAKPIEVEAVTVQKVMVDDWDTLEYYLEVNNSDLYKLTLTQNIVKRIEYKNYYDLEANPYEDPKIEVKGFKQLDLNGYSIECHDNSNACLVTDDDWFSAPDAVEGTTRDEYLYRDLIHVNKGAQLTVDDSKNTGKIHYNGYMLDTIIRCEWRHDAVDGRRRYTYICQRNIFDVDGTLVINGGNIIPGREKEQYIADGRQLNDGYGRGGNNKAFNAYAWQVIHGTAVKVNNGGTFVLNGGTLEGRGYCDSSSIDYGIKSVDSFIHRDEVVYLAEGATATINNGTLIGIMGANIFNRYADRADLTIYNGDFITRSRNDYIRLADEVVKHKRMDTMEWMGEAIDYYEFVMKDSLGFLYIPDDAWKIYLAELSVSYGEFCVWDEGRASSTIYDTAESAEEIEQLSLHMFRGEATIQRQGSSDQPILQFTNQDPVMPTHSVDTHLDLKCGDTEKFTFSHVPVTVLQAKNGYYVTRSYYLYDEKMNVLASKINDAMGTPISFEYAFNKKGNYTFREVLTLKKGTTLVEELYNDFEISVHPVVESLVVTTPPTKTAYSVDDAFDPTGMKVTAYFSDGSSKDVTNQLQYYKYFSSPTDHIEISYTQTSPFECTVRTKVPVTVDYALNRVKFRVTVPLAGNSPDFNVRDVETSKYYPAKYGPEGTGIFWYDSEGTPLDEDHVFEAGKTYQAEVKLEAQISDHAYYFKTPLEAVYLNGKDVKDSSNVQIFSNAKTFYAYIDFVCQSSENEKEITKVDVAGLTLPEPGAKPDYSATVIHPKSYKLSQYGINKSGMIWTDAETSEVLGENDTFQEGKFYTLEIKLEGYSAAYTFKNTLKATINGEYVDLENLYVNSRNTYLFATYFCGDESVLTAGGYGGDYAISPLADMDGDELITIEDAIYLLFYVNFPEAYPVCNSADIDGSGTKNIDDAIYLLFHINFPATYPINQPVKG